jgi:tetrahydromethanopterin S-methyltransferase subunit G
MNTMNTIEGERTDLGVHVDICAQRYQALDERLDKVERKVDGLTEAVRNLRGDIIKSLIATSGTIIVSLITLAGVILHFYK